MTTLRPTFIASMALLALMLGMAALGVQRLLHSEQQTILIRHLLGDWRIGPGTQDLMLGSSTILRLDPAKQLDCGNWLNRGIGSATISDIQTYLSLSPLSLSPTRILVYAGENDISNGLSVAEAQHQYQILIETLQQRHPNAHLHLLAIKSAPRRKDHWADFEHLNLALAEYASTLRQVSFHPLTVMPMALFHPDGIHLSDEGYRYFTANFNSTCKTI